MIADKMRRLLTRENLSKILRYVISGGTAAAVEYGLFYLLTSVFSVQVKPAHAAIYTVTFWISFLLNKFFTFRSQGHFWRQLVKYGLLFAFNLAVTTWLLGALISIGIAPMLAKLIQMACVTLWNFVIYQTVIYK